MDVCCRPPVLPFEGSISCSIVRLTHPRIPGSRQDRVVSVVDNLELGVLAARGDRRCSFILCELQLKLVHRSIDIYSIEPVEEVYILEDLPGHFSGHHANTNAHELAINILHTHCDESLIAF